ncbi:MAG: hypothetical protein QM496_07665 [Verrucomicrobiota bacterium]
MRILLIWMGMSMALASAKEETPTRSYEKLGILMDVSPQMGFLVPQVRKEIRLLNQRLVEAGRDPLVYREIEGFKIDAKRSLRTPASRNAVYALEGLIKEDQVAGILWITSLRGEETGFEKDEMRKIFPDEKEENGVEGEGKRVTQLLLRQTWQGHAQSGFRDVGREDVLDQILDEGLMREWVQTIKNSQGYLWRSWWLPDVESASIFAFPSSVRHGGLLRKLDVRETAAQYHDTWTSRLRMRYGLEFARRRERWARAMVGKSWCAYTTLLPRLKEQSDPPRWQQVYDQLRARDSIEQDLAMIQADKLGVMFSFAYVKRDLSAAKTGSGRRAKAGAFYSNELYASELMRIGSEAKAHAEKYKQQSDRIYALDYYEVSRGKQAVATDEVYARRMAKMIREEGVDAIYFFTNGYAGSGEYGEFGVNEPLIAQAIREAGVRLYVRVPFEFGVVPMKLHQLAVASGGGVFFGKSSDPDFDMTRPKGLWPGE